MDRIAAFKTFIDKAPADPFPRYGLAMEYRGQGRLDEAAAVFRELLESFPDYQASYLMAGETFAELGEHEAARRAFAAGVEVAGRKGDLHTRSELEAALARLDESE
jgi:tetratricopeptide (TPR) repeat protein